MIKIYLSSGCLGCRQAIAFFKRHNIQYTEHDFTKKPLTKKDIIDILSLTENGFDDILSIRSKAYKANHDRLDDLLMDQIIALIIHYPEILSRPIMLQYMNNIPYRLLIGYNSSDIEIFLRDDTARNTTMNVEEKAAAEDFYAGRTYTNKQEGKK